MVCASDRGDMPCVQACKRAELHFLLRLPPFTRRDSAIATAEAAVAKARNVRASVTRRGDTLVMAYDAVNRLLTRAVPEVIYDSVSRSIAALGQLPNLENPPYPFYPNSGDGRYRIVADTQSFAYDAMGR